MYLVADRVEDSEYGGMIGLDNILIVQTEQEAILEVQKRMYVWIFYRADQWHLENYGGFGTEIVVRQPAQYYLINPDGTLQTREEEKGRDLDVDFLTVFEKGAAPIYEDDPRGRHWNSKVIGWKFDKENDNDTI